MNKTLPMTLIVFAAMAMAAVPTASACVYYGPAAETVNYATCGARGGVIADAESLAAFVGEEADRIVAFVVDFVLGIPLP